jgi:hypothetical protein
VGCVIGTRPRRKHVYHADYSDDGHKDKKNYRERRNLGAQFQFVKHKNSPIQLKININIIMIYKFPQNADQNQYKINNDINVKQDKFTFL